MVFYISVFFTIAVLAIFRQYVIIGQRKYIDWIILATLACITGFRALGGTDIYVYKDVYERTPSVITFLGNISWYRQNLFNMEMGYLLIISVLKTFGISFYQYLLIQSVFIYTTLYAGLKRYTDYWGIIMVVFLYKMFFYDTFISMRQPITIALFIYLMHYIQEKQWVKYIAYILPVLFIHNGALVLPFIYFINFFKITRRRLIILSCLFIPTIFLTQLGIVSSAIQVMNYISGEKGYGTGESMSIFYTLEYFLIMSLVILNFRKIIHIDKYAPFILKLFLIILPLVTVFRQIVILRREIDYFILVYAIIIGYLCKCYKRYRVLIMIATIAICFYGYNRYLKNFDAGGLVPYKTWITTEIERQ